MTDHPITPPPMLVASLRISAPHGIRDADVGREIWLIHNAFAAGADQELEACCEWLQDPDLNVDTYKLRAVRRPKPPSNKEQALSALSLIMSRQKGMFDGKPFDIIRKALEALSE